MQGVQKYNFQENKLIYQQTINCLEITPFTSLEIQDISLQIKAIYHQRVISHLRYHLTLFLLSCMVQGIHQKNVSTQIELDYSTHPQ